MTKSQQSARLEPRGRDLRAHTSKLPEIPCIQECRPVVAQPPKEHKLPILTSGQKFLGNKVSAKSFRSNIFENSWKNAVIKTKRMKQEYISAYDLNDFSENLAMPSLAQEEYPAIPTPSPVTQKIQGSANSFPDSSSSNNDTNCFPSLYLHSCTSSQCSIESIHKNRSREVVAKGDAAMGDINKRGAYSWKPGILKKPEIHSGAGELGALRDSHSKETEAASRQSEKIASAPLLSKAKQNWNRSTRDVSHTIEGAWLPVTNLDQFQKLSKTDVQNICKKAAANYFSAFATKMSGYRFIDPVNGAPPPYLQRLSELAALECETVHQERSRKIRRTKQPGKEQAPLP